MSEWEELGTEKEIEMEYANSIYFGEPLGAAAAAAAATWHLLTLIANVNRAKQIQDSQRKSEMLN